MMYFFNEIYYLLGLLIFNGEYSLGFEEVSRFMCFTEYDGYAPISVIDFILVCLSIFIGFLIIFFMIKAFICFIKYLIQ